MPTYQYECQKCRHAFEALQSMTEPKFKICPECGQDELVRLIGSGSGIIFKGSGFYETDYKKKSLPKEDKDAKTDNTKLSGGSCGCGAKPAGECSGASAAGAGA